MGTERWGSAQRAWLGEIRHTIRRLAQSPTNGLAAVITMALGIGVATGAYSIIDGLVLRGVPFEDAESLVAMQRTHLSGPRRSRSAPEHDFADWRDQQQSLETLIGFHTGSVNLRKTVPDDPVLPKRYNGAWVAPGFLGLPRVHSHLGRGFEPDDAAASADPVVFIGHQVWQQDFGGGRPLRGDLCHRHAAHPFRCRLWNLQKTVGPSSADCSTFQVSESPKTGRQTQT